MVAIPRGGSGGEQQQDGAKNAFLGSHLYIKRSFYQDRLGTNIGKVEKKVAFFAGGAAVRNLGA
jgi:hypothetical protein